MTKFKILSWILIPLIIANIAASMLMVSVIYKNLYDIGYPAAPPGVNFNLSVSIVFMMLFATSLYLIYKSFIVFMDKGYFNAKSALYLTSGGYILIAIAFFGLLFTIIDFDMDAFAERESKSHYISVICEKITLFIVGFAIIAVSDIIKKGNKIKQENDLTI